MIRALAIGAACFLSFAFATMAPAAGVGGVDPRAAIVVVFGLDNSGSMRRNDPSRLTRAAVLDFARTVAARPALDARIGVVLFDASARLAAPLAPVDAASAARLERALDGLDFSGQWTDSAAAVERALYALRRDGRPEARRAIVLLSDGRLDTGSAARDDEARRALREDLAAESAAAGIQLFGVAFTEAADYPMMQALARRTGARYYRAIRAEELGSVVEDVLARLAVAERYALATDPTDAGSGARNATGTRNDPDATLDASLDASEAPTDANAPAVATGPEGAASKASVEAASQARTRRRLGLALLAFVPAALLIAGGLAFWRRRRGLLALPRPRRAAPSAQLLDASGSLGEIGASFPLRRGRTRIGRDPHNDLVLDHDTVSSEHALIELDEGRYWLEDRRSTNGTKLADRRLEPGERVPLKGGDRIRFAGIDLRFVLEGYVPGGQTVYLSSSTTPPAAWPIVSWAVGDAPPADRVESSMPGEPSTPPHDEPPARVVELDDRLADDDDPIDASRDPGADAGPSAGSDLADAPTAEVPIRRGRSRLSLLPPLEPEPEASREPEPEASVATPAEVTHGGVGEAATELVLSEDEPTQASPPAATPRDPVAAHRACLDDHLARVALLSPAFAAFVDRAFEEELRDALAVTADTLLEEARERGGITHREYTAGGVRYLVCGVPDDLERAREHFVEAWGGFTRLLTEQLDAESFRTDRCEILAVVTFGEGAAPWVSLSIVPDHGLTPGIDLLTYEFLTEAERGEIEAARAEETAGFARTGDAAHGEDTGGVSRSGLG
ncbi:MAG: FHA domain-containing protein [Myxococcota bacterium]